MTDEPTLIDRVSRRTLLKAITVATGAFGMSTPAAADQHEDETEDEWGAEDVDEPKNFNVEVLAPHATFPDDVTAEFTISYTEGEMDTIESDLADASTVVVAKVTRRPGGMSGWHTHPGSIIVNIVQGELA